MTTATYLYCLVRAAKKPASTDVPSGIPDATPPEIIAVSPSLWLVAARVPLDIYGSAALETLLSDLESVGRIAVAHEAMVEHFAMRRELTVIPMKLFTMFSTPKRAITDIAGRRKSIETAMKRIEGAEEWGVRVTTTAPTTRRAAGAPAATSGAAFLTAKKQARDDVRDAKLAAAEAAVAAFDRLAAIARDARRREAPPVSGATQPLLDAALLVASKDRDRFTDAARREADACARAGAQMTLTGPWPAYNFVQTAGHR